MSIESIIGNNELINKLSKDQISILNTYLSNGFLEEIKNAPSKRVRDYEQHQKSTLDKAIALMEEFEDIECKERLEYHREKMLHVKNELITKRLDEINTYLDKVNVSRRDRAKIKSAIKTYLKSY